MKNYFSFVLALLFVIAASGCTASMLVGDVIRSMQKDIEVVISPNTSQSSLKNYTDLGISLNGINEKGQSLYSLWGGGTTNPTIYSDMLQIELLKDGYNSKSLSQFFSENSSKTKLDSLSNNQIKLVLSGNLNLGTTSSITSMYTGGNWADTGGFTFKGIDTSNGSVLFLVSAEYGKAKKASVVTEEIANIYKDILSGEIEKYN